MEQSPVFSINYLNIHGLYNHDLKLDFRNTSNENPIYFIGKNGCYKSTVLEIIYAIFASFDAPSVINRYDIDYELEYTINDSVVRVQKYGDKYDLEIYSTYHKENSSYEVKLDTIRRKLKKYLPIRIISFYAGENDRIKKLSKTVLRSYDRMLTKELNRFIESGDRYDEYTIPKRRYFHGNDDLIPILIARAANNSKAGKIVRDVCQVESLDSIIFYSDFTLINKKKNMTINEVDRLLSCFFPYIHDYIQITDNTNEQLTERYSITCHFDDIKDNYIKELLYEFYDFLAYEFKGNLYTYVKTQSGIVNDTQLSQGQRQWAKIIGLLSLINDTNNIVLMDEPDAYMNPVWKYDFDKNIKQIIGGACPGVEFIVTHDPLLINGVPKEQIRVFERSANDVSVSEPTTDTYGLGIDGILRSSYYGLTTTFDQRTSEKYYRRMSLYSKAINNELQDKTEKRELFELTKELGDLPVFNSSIDYLYSDFLKLYSESKYSKKEYLTEEEIIEKREIMKKILDSLFEDN